MNREQKAATIDALAGELEGAQTIIAVDYRGLSVAEAADLRAKLRDAQTTLRVVKNSLTERAAAQARIEGLSELLVGPTALAFVQGDAALAAKAIAEKARATQLLPFKGGVMAAPDGAAHALDPAQLLALSRLPARQVLYGQLASIVAAPVTGLVRTLNALISGLAIALGQVREQKASEPAGASEPAAAQAEATAPDASDSAEAAEADAAASEATEQEAGAPAAAEAPGEAGAQAAAQDSRADQDQPEPTDAEPEAAGAAGPDATQET